MIESVCLVRAQHVHVDWKRPPGRPRRTWLRTIEQDLRPLNIGLVSAWQRAQDRERWKRTVETAIRSRMGHALDDDDITDATLFSA